MNERDREKASGVYLTAEEAASVLRTTRKAVYALIERGLLPGIRRIGRRVLVRRSELVAWIESNAKSSR